MAGNDRLQDFSAWVRARTDAIRVRPETIERANEIVGRQNRARALYQEWLEDTIADPSATDTRYEEARKDPDNAFLSWLSERFRDPFRVSHRYVNAAVRKYDDVDLVMRFLCTGWPSELDAADRDRQAVDDESAFLADAFLEIAKRDPGNVFRSLLDIAVDRLDEEPFAIFGVDRSGNLRGHGALTPSYPIYMRRDYATLIQKVSTQQLRHYANQARQRAEKIRSYERWQRQVADMIKRRVSHYPTPIVYGVRLGLGAHEICEMERQYLNDILAGRRDPDGDPAFRGFVDFMKVSADDPPAPPDDREVRRRQTLIAQLDADWVATLPVDLLPGGDLPQKVKAWQTAVAEGKRTPARDPVLDFIVHLKETGQMGSHESFKGSEAA